MYARQPPFILILMGLWLCSGPRSGAQLSIREPTSAPVVETYSLRVENVLYGRVEISLDRGRHAILVGRVLRPAVRLTSEKAATLPGTVLRGQSEGVTFCAAKGWALKLIPASVGSKPVLPRKRAAPGPGPAVIITDIPRGKGLFAELLPPAGTLVRLIADTPREAAFAEDYTPAPEDVFVFHVRLPLLTAKVGQTEAQREDALQEAVRMQVTALQKEYAAGALARARSAGRHVVAGTLTLRAQVPAGEPDPITAVTYMVDGKFIAAQNTAPFVYLWNTRNVEEGEHVLEIRAVNRDARPVTRVRALVVVQNNPVQNSPPPPATSAVSKLPSPPSSP